MGINNGSNINIIPELIYTSTIGLNLAYNFHEYAFFFLIFRTLMLTRKNESLILSQHLNYKYKITNNGFTPETKKYTEYIH